MSYYAYDMMGESIDYPHENEMRQLLASVAAEDPENPDVSLNDEAGWSLSYGFSKTIILENAETDEGPWHMKDVSLERALALWQLLANDDQVQLHAQAWSAGYGS